MRTYWNWKGDEVGYAALHDWVKRRLEKPKACQDCGQEKPLDLANISQKYKRDLTDWEWICRSCHMTKDGRLKALLAFPAKDKDMPRGDNHYAFGRKPEEHPMYGRHLSKETREKIAKAHMGIPVWNKGMKLQPLSEEAKEKVSQSLRGRVFSEEHKRRLSLKAKERYIKEGQSVFKK